MNEHTLYSGLPSVTCEEVLKWKHPFTCIVGGPSCSDVVCRQVNITHTRHVHRNSSIDIVAIWQISAVDNEFRIFNH